MRERIRARFRELDSDEAARATEGAFISTIHGFCARVLRAHALAAGLDPAFVVLDAPDAERLADAAFDEALEELAPIDLIAAYTAGGLRSAILQVHDELRSRGERRPRLPALPPAPDLSAARDEVSQAAAAAARELGTVVDPGPKVLEALARLERVPAVIAADDPWPGDLWAVALPGGNGAALCTDVCLRYAEALTAFRVAAEHRRAVGVHDLLDRLLRGFAERYAHAKREVSGLDFEDLELECRELLRSNPELRERYRTRFERIMVDELQDTNLVQLELIESIAHENLFTVGDAHAIDLRVPARRRRAVRGARRAARGGRRARHAGHQLPLPPRDPFGHQRRVRAVPTVAPRPTARAGARGAARRAAGRRQGGGLGDGGTRRAVAGRRGAGAGGAGGTFARVRPGGPRRGAAHPRHHRPARVRARARGARDPDLRDRRARLLVAPAGDRHGQLPRGAGQPARGGGAVHGAELPAGRGIGRRAGRARLGRARPRRRPLGGAARARRCA